MSTSDGCIHLTEDDGRGLITSSVLYRLKLTREQCTTQFGCMPWLSTKHWNQDKVSGMAWKLQRERITDFTKVGCFAFFYHS